MKIAIVLLAAALLVIGVVYGRAADRTDRTPVPSFDLARYMGTWYEIARYDHPFERGLAGVQARYELRPDGRIGEPLFMVITYLDNGLAKKYWVTLLLL